MIGFNVSFRASHATLDLSSFLAPLSVEPSHCWKVGDKRRTPKGRDLQGVHDMSYYCCHLPVFENSDLGKWLEGAIAFLRPMAKSFISFTDDGGSLSFFIGLEKGVFEGVALAPALLAELGALRISLDIDRNL